MWQKIANKILKAINFTIVAKVLLKLISNCCNYLYIIH